MLEGAGLGLEEWVTSRAVLTLHKDAQSKSEECVEQRSTSSGAAALRSCATRESSRLPLQADLLSEGGVRATHLRSLDISVLTLLLQRTITQQNRRPAQFPPVSATGGTVSKDVPPLVPCSGDRG